MTQKTPNDWSSNPSGEANLKTYDTLGATYDDSSTTYDNIVPGDVADTEKQPNAWSPL